MSNLRRGQPTSPSRGRGRGRGRGGGANRGNEPPEVRISKAMSYVLRHGAEKDGVPIRADGYVLVSDLLKHPRLRQTTLEQIQQIVATNNKQRFTLIEEDVVGSEGDANGKIWLVRANQGHSLEVKVEMTPITSADEALYPIHGTYRKSWQIIEKEGLKPMTRQHVHLAAGKPGENGVISGMRQSSDVYIYIDLAKALNDGIPFYRSANNVILTPGNKDGVLPPQYFSKVEDRNGKNLLT